MPDQRLVSEILGQILEAARRIERRSADIRAPADFLKNDENLDKLDAICMMLIAIGESLKNLDKVTGNALLARYPQFDWKGAKGVRDVISHHYFDLNADVVFAICRERIPGLISTIEAMKRDLG